MKPELCCERDCGPLPGHPQAVREQASRGQAEEVLGSLQGEQVGWTHRVLSQLLERTAVTPRSLG